MDSELRVGSKHSIRTDESRDPNTTFVAPFRDLLVVLRFVNRRWYKFRVASAARTRPASPWTSGPASGGSGWTSSALAGRVATRKGEHCALGITRVASG